MHVMHVCVCACGGGSYNHFGTMKGKGISFVFLYKLCALKISNSIEIIIKLIPVEITIRQ